LDAAYYFDAESECWTGSWFLFNADLDADPYF
jgi:hypothetical protein